jgi:glycerol-3-phosphate cytidylyltransferase-like family protein
MKKPIYKTAVTFARCNIPHYGHVELVEKMLEQAEVAHVYLSIANNNTNWDARVLTLRHLLREVGVDLKRVKTLKASGPFQAVESTLEHNNDTVVVLGEDQSALCEKLCATYNLGGQLNRRTGSSTQVRHLMDHGDFDAVQALYRNDPYALRLALLLRKEELNHGNTRVA